MSDSSSENAQAITYRSYSGEDDLKLMQPILEKDLSEPYSLFTYRFFLHPWPKLSFLAFRGKECVGAIIAMCVEPNVGHTSIDYGNFAKARLRGYIGMVAISDDCRKRGIGRALVNKSMEEMRAAGATEVVLDTELENKAALEFYRRLGFIRDKRRYRYYLGGQDAFRLRRWL